MIAETIRRRSTAVAAETLAILALVLLAAVLNAEAQLRLATEGEADILAHASLARDILLTGVLYPGHFLYHLLVDAAFVVLPVSWLQAHVLVIVLARIALVLMLYRLVRGSLHGFAPASSRLFAVVVAVALTVVTAISFLTWGADNYYYGYLLPNVYHNPTFFVMQPTALLAFFAVSRVVSGPPLPGMLGGVVPLAFASILSVLAKPSFMLAFIPAVGLLMIIHRRLRDVGVMATLAIGVVLPALAVMAWQYTSTYLAVQRIEAGDDVGLRFAPFFVVRQDLEIAMPGAPDLLLLPMLAGALAFPVAVALVYRRIVPRDPRLLLAWLLFACGAGLALLVAEHPISKAGNYLWSGHIALFVLFVVSTLVFIEQAPQHEASPWRGLIASPGRAVCTLLFGLHLVAGVGWFVFVSW